MSGVEADRSEKLLSTTIKEYDDNGKWKANLTPAS